MKGLLSGRKHGASGMALAFQPRFITQVPFGPALALTGEPSFRDVGQKDPAELVLSPSSAMASGV